MLKDISGWNDIVDCFTKGDIWACGGLVMNLVPWGKVGKVLEAGYKAVRATVMMAKVISKAQGLLRRVEKVAAAAQEIAAKAIQKLGGKADDFGGSCPLHSFVAGTRVLMADGSSKPIDQMQVGDKVKATDATSGQTSDREVVATIVHTDEGDMTRLSVAGGTIDATSWHPVWVEERGDFTKIGDLKAGEHLRSSDGTRPVVTDVQRYAQIQLVYDLTIDGIHTYHVAVAGTPVLVHNCGEFEDFAHGTDLKSAENILNDGLSEVASKDNLVGSKAPGNFFTVPVDQADIQAALDTAAYWGGRHGGQTCVVVCRLPSSVLSNLESSSLLRRTTGPTQAVFHPDSFKVINEHAEWFGPIT